MRKKVLWGLCIGSGAAAIAMIMLLAGWLTRFEDVTWSWRVKWFARPSVVTEKIKLILIDQAGLDWGAKEQGLSWPWPRQVYAPIIDFCRRSGAKVLVFDMLYSEPSSHGVEDDRIFGRALARDPDCVAAFFLGNQAQQARSWPKEIPDRSIRITGLDAWLNPERSAFLEEPGAAFPIPEIAHGAALIASVKEDPDPDGTLRRISLFRLFDRKMVSALSLGAYLASEQKALRRPSLHIQEGRLDVDKHTVPIDATGRAIINFRGKSGTHQIVSAAAVIQSEVNLAEGKKPPIEKTDLFKDCYVFLGLSAPGLKDLKATPVSGDYPGVEIHATVLDNLLADDFIREAPLSLVLLGTLVLALLAALCGTVCRTGFQTILCFVFFLALPAVMGFALYRLEIWWPMAVGELAAGLALIGAVILNYTTEGRQKRFIKEAFKQYLSPQVIEQILVDPSQLQLGGEKKELTIFFSDLEKFSSFSEKLDPRALTSLLNDYLSDMSAIISEQGGTLDKYIGDAIVAFWNAPLDQADHALRACRAAFFCQQRLAQRRQELFEKTGALLKMRVGIHTGDVSVGNMGSSMRFNYTVLGDAANLASRLEGSNKVFGTFTMVSESTWARVQGSLFGRELGKIRVVGRETPVRVFEPLGMTGDPIPPFLQAYEKGLALCYAGRLAGALAIFETLEDDPPSRVYADLCRGLLAQSSHAWDGIWNLTEK